MASTDDAPDPRYFGIHEGEVVENNDPKGMGRITVCVPGITPDDGGAWFFPTGMPGGGAPARGTFDVPDVGASVNVFFLGGDPDKGRYMAGPWGRPGGQTAIPSAAASAFAEDPSETRLVRVIHENKLFQVVNDEREGRSRLYINLKGSGEDLDLGSAVMLEFDAEAKTVAISGTAAITLRSAGIVDIQGSVIQIGGRKVTQGISSPI